MVPTYYAGRVATINILCVQFPRRLRNVEQNVHQSSDDQLDLHYHINDVLVVQIALFDANELVSSAVPPSDEVCFHFMF